MTFIGQSARRVEDERFLTGRGTFVEDVEEPDQLWAYVVRSPHAHAMIENIDSNGVSGASVFTYADIADLGLLPCATAVATVSPMLVPPRPALANGRVRHVGGTISIKPRHGDTRIEIRIPLPTGLPALPPESAAP